MAAFLQAHNQSRCPTPARLRHRPSPLPQPAPGHRGNGSGGRGDSSDDSDHAAIAAGLVAQMIKALDVDGDGKVSRADLRALAT